MSTQAVPSPSSEPARAQRELEDLVGAALEEAKRQGATSAEAAASRGQGLSVSVRMGEVETVEHTRDKELTVTVYAGHRSGSASTSDFSRAALADTVRAAASIARLTAEDPASGLADPEMLARDIPDLDLYHTWEVSPGEAIEIAKRCEDAARGTDSRIVNSEGAGVSSHDAMEVYGNSHGFTGRVRASRHGLSCAVVGRDEAGMQRDYWYTAARDAGELEDAELIGRKAAARTVARLDARRLGTRQCPVLYEAPVAASLLSHFVSAVRGSALYRNASFLVDHLGKPVFVEDVRIHEAPHIKRAMGSAPFDNEGVATRAHDLVSAGVLESYVLDSYSARKLGMQTTGNAGGVHNLCLDPGPLDFDALLKEMDTGLLVTELIGFGVNNVTGDYSRGAAGFWIDNGAIAYPVQEITVAGNLRDMFRSIARVGSDVDTRGSIRTGSILIERMTVAGE